MQKVIWFFSTVNGVTGRDLAKYSATHAWNQSFVLPNWILKKQIDINQFLSISKKWVTKNWFVYISLSHLTWHNLFQFEISGNCKKSAAYIDKRRSIKEVWQLNTLLSLDVRCFENRSHKRDRWRHLTDVRKSILYYNSLAYENLSSITVETTNTVQSFGFFFQTIIFPL